MIYRFLDYLINRNFTVFSPEKGLKTNEVSKNGNNHTKSFHDSEFIGGPQGNRADWRYPSKNRLYYIYVEGQKLYVSEGIYDETVRADWRMKKEYELRTKCIITTEKGNPAVCRKSCAECPFYSKRRMNLISIEYMDECFL